MHCLFISIADTLSTNDLNLYISPPLPLKISNNEYLVISY